MRFQDPKNRSHIHSIVRGLLMRENDIILCHIKGADWYFLPGGHIEDGESAFDALKRELREELGDGDYHIDAFVGVCENIFPLKPEVLQHEITIIFSVDLPSIYKPYSQEDDLEFVAVAKQDLKNYKILPKSLKSELLEWIEKQKPFFMGLQ